MSKTAVVYWSGTGNTEAMAAKVVEGAQAAGAEVSLFTAAEFGADKMDEFDSVAFGCPSMGTEQLEDSEMEPFVEELEPMISGKQLLLFGSYGWGDGEWMRDWCQRMEEAGAHLICEEGVIANETPDDAALEECRAAGKELITASV